jgi:hypothetical protein
MNTYLRILAVFYLYGALVHLADLLSLGHHLGQTHSLALPEMSMPWQIGTVGSAAVDLVAAAGLWLRAWWGVMAFLAFAGFLTADGGLVVTALLGGRMLGVRAKCRRRTVPIPNTSRFSASCPGRRDPVGRIGAPVFAFPQVIA